MFNILSYLPGRKRSTTTGWQSFNAVCCHHRGHKADTRGRAGVKYAGDAEWTYHCFNCDFKASYRLGKKLTINTRNLLRWLGLEAEEIQQLELASLRARELGEILAPSIVPKKFEFHERALPDRAEPLDINNDAHLKYLHFLIARGLDPTAYPYYVTPNEPNRHRNRIIIPYFLNNKIVGSTSRYIDGTGKKYIKDAPSGYLFGLDFQQPHWQNVLVVEGELDAVSIRACAIMTNTISNEHAQQLARLYRPVIVVPDHDHSGMQIIDRALELGYSVSIPPWRSDIKDVNDAVREYGVAATLLSIHRAATRNRLNLELTRRQYENKQK